MTILAPQIDEIRSLRDTTRAVYCVTYVAMEITGRSREDVERAINRSRMQPEGAAVRGVHIPEMRRALRLLGHRCGPAMGMLLGAPTVRQWVEEHRPIAEDGRAVLISSNHAALVRRGTLYDTHNLGGARLDWKSFMGSRMRVRYWFEVGDAGSERIRQVSLAL